MKKADIKASGKGYLNMDCDRQMEGHLKLHAFAKRPLRMAP